LLGGHTAGERAPLALSFLFSILLDPKASNKADVAGGADVPVQNGKANFSVPATVTFQPDCSPPMTVVFQNVTDTVTAADGTNLSFTFPGTL
jgi:hypothetical protein